MADEINELDYTVSIAGTEWHGKAHHEAEINEVTAKNCFFPIVTGTPSVEIETVNDAGEAEMKIIHLNDYKSVLADLRHREDLPEHFRTFHPLHTPKDSYRPISNKEIWDCMTRSIAGLGVKITTIGTLDNCKKFYISVDLNGGEYQATNGDKFSSYLNFLTSHDGTMMFEARDSMIRVVCMNTFRWSRAYDGAVKVAVPHTKNAAASIENLGAYFQSVLYGRQRIMENMDYLQTLTLESPTEAAYAAAGFLSGRVGERAESLSTRSYNRAEEIKALTVRGMGNSGKSRYDLFNGFTEYFTHGDGAGGSKADKSKRWSVGNFGMAAKHKEDFLTLLTDEDSYRETVAYGEKLVKEYA
jgi:hypothetical protein